MNHRLRFAPLLPLALLLGSASLHAQTPPAPATPVAGTPAPDSVLAQAKADVAAKRFTEAVTLLQSQQTIKTDASLRHALADAQSAWAQDLFAPSQYAEAIPPYAYPYYWVPFLLIGNWR